MENQIIPTAGKHYIFPPERFHGYIQVGGQRIEISLSASVDRSGRLSLLDVDPIKDVAGGLKLMESLNGSGNTVEEFQLECEGSDGKKLTSDRAYLASGRQKLTPIDCSHKESDRRYLVEFNIQLRTVEACLTMKASETSDLPQITLSLLGFESFSPLCATTRFGTVKAWEVRADLGNEITGKLAIQGQKGLSSNWHTDAKRLLDDIRLVLGFARGAPLRVPIMKFFSGDCGECTFYDVEGCPPYMPPFHHLNLDPIFSTAIKHTDIIAEHRDVLETTIGWLLVKTDYEEIRFMSGMTALETAVSKCLDDKEMFVLKKSKFRKLKSRISEFVKQQNDLDLNENDYVALDKKLPELNRNTFKHNLILLLTRWGISRSDIDDHALSRLLKLRNEIVHQGATPKVECLRENDEILREILVRLVLAIIRFDGTYESYVGGPHSRKFPVCEPSA